MAINYRILYVDTMPNGNTIGDLVTGGTAGSDYTTLRDWCIAKEITGIKWYGGNSFSTAQWTNLRAIISDLRNNSTVQSHQLVIGGSPYPSTTSDLTVDPYGYKRVYTSDKLATPTPNTGDWDARFFTADKNSGYDLEDEFYSTSGGNIPQNHFEAMYRPKVENGARGLLYSDLNIPPVPGQTYTRKDGANTSYLGWWNTVPAAPDIIVTTHTRIDLHHYTQYNWGLSALGNYGMNRYEDLGKAQEVSIINATPNGYKFFKNNEAYFSTKINDLIYYTNVVTSRNVTNNNKFEIYPIFSLEAANLAANGTYNHLSSYFPDNNLNNNFAGMFCSAATLPGVVPIVGQDLTFDELFNYYLANNATGTGNSGGFRAWAASNTAGEYIKEPDGYVLFDYCLAYAARPSTISP